MLTGSGIDIVEVERVKKYMENDRFMARVYTQRELEYIKSRKLNPQTAAGIFAAKEAVAKSLGTGFVSFGPADVEIVPDEAGCPQATLKNGALNVAEKEGITAISVSISHIKDLAIAMAVAEK